MWKTVAAREMGFNESFAGYCNAEDLEFSLRMKSKGRLVMTGKARVLHLQDPTARPNAYEMGYMNMHNAYYIHRSCLPHRTWKDTAWFIYAYGLDALMQCANLIWPGGTLDKWRYLRGHLRFLAEVVLMKYQMMRHQNS